MELQKERKFIINEMQLANIINLLQTGVFNNLNYISLNNFLMSLGKLEVYNPPEPVKNEKEKEPKK